MYEYTPKYISPRGAGRPPERNDKEILVSDLWIGVNTFYDPTRIDGNCRLAFNTRCFEGSTIDRRLGFAPTGTVGGAGRVYAEMVLQQVSGADILLRIIEGAGAGVQLQKWTGSAWSNINGNIGTADDRVDFSWTYVQIGGEDRVYFTNGVSDLMYTEGTTTASVSGVKAKYVTTKENILIVGCMKDIYPENAFVWAKAGSHQFYLDNETYSTSSNVAYVDGPITQLKAFNWLIYAFTEADGLFETDISSAPAPRKISTHGTMSPKSVAIGFDSMMWADQYGVWQMAIGGDVVKVSKTIDSMYKCITLANFYDITGGMNANEQYELHVGNLVFEGVTYNNLAFIYEVEQSRFYETNIWRIDKDKMFANNIVTIADSYGFFSTYYGSRETQTTYQTDIGDNDNTEPIEMIWQSKDFSVTSENQEYKVDDLYIRYTPLGSDEIPITVYMRKDTETWQLLGSFNLPVGSGEVKLLRLSGVKGLTGRTLAFRFVSESVLPTSIKQVLLTYSYNQSELPLLAPVS